jgi:phage-related protein
VERTRIITACFYKTSTGRMPVRDWLLSLSKEDRIKIGGDIANVEYHWPVGPPKCKPIGDGMFEIRSRISGGRIARVLFFTEFDRLYLLHGFFKKTSKIPKRDLDLARNRKKEIEGCA